MRRAPTSVPVLQSERGAGTLTAYVGTRFAGNQAVTRYELALILWRLQEALIRRIEFHLRQRGPLPPNWPPTPIPAPPFADVPDTHWAASAVVALHGDWGTGTGILTGYPDGAFAGARPATRYEFAVALHRLLNSISAIVNRLPPT